MASIQKCIRLPEATVKEIESAASSSGRDFSSVARDLLVEAVKMKNCPGIIYADGPTGRRARVSGAGIDVWEIAAAFKGMDENYTELQKAYHWLSEPQLRSALSYFTLHPEEIEARIARNQDLTSEKVAKRFPFLARKPAAE
ncbi:MAG: hypothetical protein EHM37_14250 [Deltaproteobacteria bacterium]|nr:MAG: hypothetical protein EHM37_14250 [Deltaproteobacteria bacterium]